MPRITKAQDLKDMILACTACPLHKDATAPVPFRGRRSSILVLGEAPGQREDARGRPFVGPAGRFLWTELEKVGIERSDVFAANAVCCFPHRTPTSEEVYACRINLWRQIHWCNPRVILALGKTANFTLGKQNLPISKLRGEWYDLLWFANDQFPEHDVIEVFPTLHPAAVLRNKTLLRGWREDLQTFATEAL